MQIIDKYIGRAVLTGVTGALLVMLALDILITFAGEVSSIGKANYTAWYAMAYVLLLVPQKIYLLFPMTALLGTVMGLGLLSAHSELIAVRAAGISIARITVSVLKTGAIIVLLALFVGEVVAPPAVQYAKLKRVAAMNQKISLNTDYGLWARDGENYIQIRRVESSGQLVGIAVYRFDENRMLKETIKAAAAEYIEDHWVLYRVTRKTISNDAISEDYTREMVWKSLLNPEIVNVVSVTPDNLSMWKLHGYIGYLRDNQLDAKEYELSFWNKVIMPVTIAAMIILAVPFVFGTLRDAGTGQRLLVGFMLGLGFFLLNRLLGNAGLVYDIHPAVLATIPTILALAVGSYLIHRCR